MSNFRAVATVTATLSETLQSAVGKDVPGAEVTPARPDAHGGGAHKTGIHLFLYQVTPNAAWRNADLPTRNAAGALVERPRTGIDLHYLLSFYGDESKLEPQLLLGSAVRTLHTLPVLTRSMIRQTIAGVTYGFLAQSDLADDIELVKFAPLPLSLEELSKLWSVFFQTAYALSVAYVGTVVLLEADAVPAAGLPVQERTVTVVPVQAPVIAQVADAAGAARITAKSTLRISGRHLRGQPTVVRVAGMETTVAPAAVGDTEIVIALAALPGPILAGVHPVQAVHPLMLGSPPAAHPGAESNVAPIIVHPVLTGAPTVSNVVANADGTRSANVNVAVDPGVGAGQRALLILNSKVGGLRNYAATQRPAATTAALAFAVTVQPGDYLVRLQVDGAETAVDLNPASPTYGPVVTVA